jgi:hypothetical protein
MDTTKDGGLIAGGWSFSNISGQKTENRKGSNDYWVVKLNSNHKIQWDKTIGGNNTDYCHGLSQTADGGYIIAGSSFSDISGEKSESGRGGDQDSCIPGGVLGLDGRSHRARPADEDDLLSVGGPARLELVGGARRLAHV